MILFINIKITNERLLKNNFPRFRGLLSNPSRILVYKYMLESLAIIPHFSKAIFYINLDEEFKNQQEELERYTKSLFSHIPVSYFNFRNEYQKQWRKNLEEVMDDKDELIWFLGNDDHIFMDYDFQSIEDVVSVIDTKKYESFMFSHYPETLKAAANQGNKKVKNLFYHEGKNIDSIQVVTKKLLHYWFFCNTDTEYFMPRTDWLFVNIKTPLIKHYSPIKECCRHFEGYPNVSIDYKICPPLDIPCGFFEKNIQIACGTDKRPDKTWTFFHPGKEYSMFDENGCDYKWIMKDVPLFWKNKISNTLVEKEYIEERTKEKIIYANSRPNQEYIIIDEKSILEVI